MTSKKITPAVMIATAAIFATGVVLNPTVPGVYADPKSTLGESGLSAGAVDRHQGPEPLRVGHGIDVGDTAYVAVSAATLWKSPKAPRAIDKPALQYPVNMSGWDKALNSVQKRRGLTGKTETQAIFADPVVVTEVKDSWAKVGVTTEPNPGDKHGYQAWMPTAQLVENNSYTKALEKRNIATVTAKTTSVKNASGTVSVPMNSRLPVVAQGGDTIRVILPDGSWAIAPTKDVRVGSAGATVPKPQGDELVATAKKFLGLKYVWGGTSAYGFDCSGLTYSVYRAHGITIPRDSGPQSKAGKGVKLKNLKKGDLVFFASRGGKGAVYHVGMYIGGGKMIHAPNASKSVETVTLRTWSGFGDYAGAQRFL